jgi:C4-dicarboxylate transporter DctM subunit
MGTLLLISFIFLVIIGTPIAFVLTGTTLMSQFFGTANPVMTVSAQQMFVGCDVFALLAIPLFMVAGSLMGEGGISHRLIDFCDSLVGHLTGGLAYVAILACMIFAAISGSGPATVAALGAILIAGMVELGYPAGFATACLALAGAIGVIIPPSIPMVVYSSVANTSVGAMFLGGFGPGILVGLALMFGSYILCKRGGFGLPAHKRTTWRQKGHALKDAFWALLMPIIILGGIYGGIFTPTEAAAVAVAYGFIVSVFVYKELTFAKLKKVLLDASKNTAMVMMIIGAAKGFGILLTTQHVPEAASRFLLSITDSKFGVLLIINILLLFVGCIMECNAAILILTPILLPVVTQLGVNPIHFGIIMIVNMAIGMSTPPLGVNLFVGCGISKIKIEDTIKYLVPMLIANILALFLITYVEPIAMALVRLIGKG